MSLRDPLRFRQDAAINGLPLIFSISVHPRPGLLATRGRTVASAEPVRTKGEGATGKQRSSNLRVRKAFTDADKDQFLDEGFEYIAKFFDNSLQELTERNADIQSKFQRIDARHFEASVYRQGKIQSRIRVVLRGSFGGISYSTNPQANDSSVNGWMNVEADDQSLYLTGSFGFRSDKQKLTFEGAAEQLWEQLIERLQN